MAQSNRKFYRDNGAAAYDVYAWNDQAARQYEDGRAYERSRQYELPEEQVREQPYRRVKARTAIAPFTLAGMLTVACGRGTRGRDRPDQMPAGADRLRELFRHRPGGDLYPAAHQRLRRDPRRHAAEHLRPHRVSPPHSLNRIFDSHSSISLDRTSQLEIRPNRGGLCRPPLF